MKFFKSLLIVLIIGLFACSSGDKKSAEQVEPLNYNQTIALIFPDSSKVGEWHGNPMNLEAQTSLAFSNGDANGNCGVKIMLTNSSDQSVLTTVTTIFPFTDDPWEVSYDYTLSAGETKHVGNSQICHGGKNTPFEWKIRGAAFED